MTRVVFCLLSPPVPVDPARLPSEIEKAIEEAEYDAEHARLSGDFVRERIKREEIGLLHRALVRHRKRVVETTGESVEAGRAA